MPGNGMTIRHLLNFSKQAIRAKDIETILIFYYKCNCSAKNATTNWGEKLGEERICVLPEAGLWRLSVTIGRGSVIGTEHSQYEPAYLWDESAHFAFISSRGIRKITGYNMKRNW